MKKTVVAQKSLMSSHEERMFIFCVQNVCVCVRYENKSVEGSLCQENVREVFVGVRGEIFYS